MMRADRAWTAVIAECGLHRAGPVLAALCPGPFGRVKLGDALAASGILVDRNTAFGDVQPALAAALGPDAEAVMQALGRLPMDAAAQPATAFWRGMFRDLHGRNHPPLSGEAARVWAVFVTAFRGRNNAVNDGPEWVAQIAAGSQFHRDLVALVRRQRALPLSAHDRGLYVRFGWNDDGDVPGMTGLMDAAALLRTGKGWAAVAGFFNEADQAIIMTAARDLMDAHRAGALATLNDDARRYGISRDRLEAALYPLRAVPPLADILTEAEQC